MRNVNQNLLNRLKSQFQTKANDAQPIMNVYMARARSTISDSAYWTVETIREMSGLGDVSLAPRRFKVKGTPNRIYEIHVHDGVVKTSIREYPDKLKDGFIDQFSLGNGSAVALAFDGHWERYRDLWRLVTDEKPWIFWVDGSNKLWTQLWDETDTKLELATGVTYVRATRAWKNLNLADSDQGVVVAYIKSDGKVYYRNYCEYVDNTFAWESERQLEEFTQTATSLNLFITNDYRMGFAVEDSTQDIHWFITERNWAGMAIDNHKITVSSSIQCQLLDIIYSDLHEREKITVSVNIEFANEYAGLINSFVQVYNEEFEGDWGRVLNIEFYRRMFDLSSADITLVDSKAVEYSPQTVTRLDDFNYKLEFFNFHNIGEEGTIKFNGVTGKNYINELYSPFEDLFYPLNLEPVLSGPPEVEVIWNE